MYTRNNVLQKSCMPINSLFTRGVRGLVNFMVVLIALVLIFKTQLTSLVETIFEKITSESAGI